MPCYRARVRSRVALAAGLAVASLPVTARADVPVTVRADAPADPRGLFGLDPRKRPADRNRDVAHPAAPPPAFTSAGTVGCVSATDPLDPASPAALRTVFTARYLLVLPVADARHDVVASYATGASRDDAGPAFGGATGLENRWSIEGAPVDSVRTGGTDTRVPLAFIESLGVTAGGFSARDRISTGGTIDAQLRRGGTTHELEVHAWGGYTTEPPRRPIPRGAYTVRRATGALAPDATLSLLATGPLSRLAGGRTWYALGVAPELSPVDYTWRASRLTDADGDGTPDGFPGVITLTPIETTRARTLDFAVPVLARLGWEHGHHALDLTLVGSAGRDASFLANATIDTGIERTSLVADGIATYRGRWRSTTARVQLAWHRSQRRDAPRTAAADARQLQSAYVPATLASDPVLAAACTDAMDLAQDPTPAITNCPVPFGFFVSGGAGLLVEQTADRPSVTAELAHQIGVHVLRVGTTGEDARLVTTSRYSGGALVRSLFDGHTDTEQFYGTTCAPEAGGACEYRASQALTYRSRYAAAYVEDTAEVAPGLRIDGGLRVELMEVGTQLQFDHELAPRFAVAYDFLGGGASRAFASYTRSYAMLPAGLGATVTAGDRTVRDIASPLGTDRRIDTGASTLVAAGIEPVAQDEGTAGVEVGQAGLARIGAWVQGRSLKRGLETVSLDRERFTVDVDNPGRTAAMPPARRDTLVAAFEVALVPSPATTIRATYSFTRAVGNWTGPYDPRQGATLYAGTDFDLDRTNVDGRLPTDAGHRFALEAAHRGHLRGLEVGASTRVTLQSGRPRNVLASTDQGLVYLLPRGEYGRSQMISQVNLRLLARWHATDITLDAFNVFDRAVATSLDEVYANLTTRPIVGGDASDLVFLRYEGGDTLRRRTAFHAPTGFQPPFAVSLGIHRAF